MTKIYTFRNGIVRMTLPLALMILLAIPPTPNSSPDLGSADDAQNVSSTITNANMARSVNVMLVPSMTGLVVHAETGEAGTDSSDTTAMLVECTGGSGGLNLAGQGGWRPYEALATYSQSGSSNSGTGSGGAAGGSTGAGAGANGAGSNTGGGTGAKPALVNHFHPISKNPDVPSPFGPSVPAQTLEDLGEQSILYEELDRRVGLRAKEDVRTICTTSDRE